MVSKNGATDQFSIQIEHQVRELINKAKEEGVPITGHPIEGLDNTGEGSGGALDPFAQLFANGFGWLIDSVAFLRDPIDKLDGDAAAVQTAVDSMKTVTENLKFTARSHRGELPSLADWEGDAAEAHRASMKLLTEEILSLGHVVEGLGTLMAISGGMVITLRKIVRELVATVIGAIVIIMLAAAAAAFWTLGTSLIVGAAASVAAAVAVMVDSMRRISLLDQALNRQVERMGELEGIAGDVSDGLTRFEKAAGIPPSGGKGSEGEGPGKKRDEAGGGLGTWSE